MSTSAMNLFDRFALWVANYGYSDGRPHVLESPKRYFRASEIFRFQDRENLPISIQVIRWLCFW
jgi:hypothetical protein